MKKRPRSVRVPASGGDGHFSLHILIWNVKKYAEDLLEEAIKVAPKPHLIVLLETGETKYTQLVAPAGYATIGIQAYVNHLSDPDDPL